MFSKKFLTYFRNLAIFTLILLAISIGLVSYEVIHPFTGQLVIYALLFFLPVSALTFYLMQSSLRQTGQNAFMKRIGLSILLKIILSLIFLLFLLYQFEGKTITIVVLFFMLYFLYSGFVITHIFSNLRQISDPHKNAKNNHPSD